MIRTKESEEKAEKAALKALLDLTHNTEFNEILYYSAAAIGRRVPRDKNSYGVISPDDISNLLEKYISNNLVLEVTIVSSGCNIYYKGYIANLERELEIKRTLEN